MRRLLLLGLGGFALSGCAFHEWDRPPFFSGPDPYAPSGDTENMRRARGQATVVQPLTPMAGNVWPGPLPPTVTLEDLVKQEQQNGGQLAPEQRLPGQPAPPAIPAPESAPAPPPTVQPVVPQIPPVPNVAGSTPPASPSNGGVVQTPQGPAVTSGGTGTFKSVTMPNGLTGIVVPNGNGTSTIILSNGQVQTVPDHK